MLSFSALLAFVEQSTPVAVGAHILGWSASTAVRMAKRYDHIRPEVQRQALERLATAEIQPTANQFVHQVGSELSAQPAYMLRFLK
jgi:hypothetical protein